MEQELGSYIDMLLDTPPDTTDVTQQMSSGTHKFKSGNDMSAAFDAGKERKTGTAAQTGSDLTRESGTKQLANEFVATRNEHITADQENNILETGRNRSNAVLEDFNGAQATKINPLQNNNFAINGRYGNLNNRSYNQTLNMSRLADYLNNKRHLVGTEIGARTGGQWSSTGIDKAGSMRWEPIDTQEMRQMRTNEKIAEQQLKADTELQAAINRYPFELQQQMDNITNRAISTISEDNISARRAFHDALLEIQYRNPAQLSQSQAASVYAKYLSKELDTKLVNKVMQLYKDNPLWAGYYSMAMGLGASPSLMDNILGDIMNKITAMTDDPTEQWQIMQGMQGLLALMGMFYGGQGFMTGLYGNLFNYR